MISEEAMVAAAIPNPSTTKRRLRLVLHAADGSIPYLSPSLLDHCFPVRDTPDLMLGLAVRDTAASAIPAGTLVPKNARPHPNDDATNTSTSTATKQKPKGYGFATSTTIANKEDNNNNNNNKDGDNSSNVIHGVDAWIQDYPRVVVPAFDLLRQRPGLWLSTLPSTKDEKNDDPHDLSVTDRGVRLWTPHGRLLLTPEDCVRASRRLQTGGCGGGGGTTVVPLYDVVPPMRKPAGSAAVVKRHEAALRRCQEWHRVSLHPPFGFDPQSVFAPIVVDPNLSSEPDESNDGGNDEILDDFVGRQLPPSEGWSDRNRIRRLALLGWHTLVDPHARRRILTAALTSLLLPRLSETSEEEVPEKEEGQPSSDASLAPAEVLLLATDSLQQVLDAVASLAATVNDDNEQEEKQEAEATEIPQLRDRPLSQVSLLVGSHLPQLWARTKRAFALPLEPGRRLPKVTSETKSHREGDSLQEQKPPKRSRSSEPPPSPRDGNHDNDHRTVGSATLDRDGCVDLTPTDPPYLHPWFRDRGPLVDGCDCWACASHTRAYVYHLSCANELLGEVVLFVHNLHHLLRLMGLANNALHTHNNVSGDNDSRCLVEASSSSSGPPVQWTDLESQWQSRLAGGTAI